MSAIRHLIEDPSKTDPEFRVEYEAEALRLALVRARQTKGMSQRDLADRLGVSQPRIAQVERGTRPMSMSFLLRYAAAVNARLEVLPRG